MRYSSRQSVLTVSQTYWCLALTSILTSDESTRQKTLEDFEQKSYLDLNKLAALVRQELPQVRSRAFHFNHRSNLFFNSSFVMSAVH